MSFSEAAWRFPFIRACVALFGVGCVLAHTVYLFGLSIDLLFIGFVFASVWALTVSYSTLAFPNLWKQTFEVDIPKNENSVVSQETVYKHKRIIGVHESRVFVRFSLYVYVIFLLTKSVFVDNITEPVFYFAILCGLYVLSALSEYWERDEKTMWVAFLKDEYSEDDYK